MTYIPQNNIPPPGRIADSEIKKAENINFCQKKNSIH